MSDHDQHLGAHGCKAVLHRVMDKRSADALAPVARMCFYVLKPTDAIENR